MPSPPQRSLGWRLLKVSAASFVVLLGLALTYKAKRVLQINVFPGIDMVPDEQLKAAVIWTVHMILGPIRGAASLVLSG